MNDVNNNPKVTVLMPVYNGEKHLREAMDSILNQTFTDFEFLIINDGSTDSSVKIINSYKDSRIRLIHNEKNLKLIATLNKGLNLACGKYIARMDCDDISLPTRLEKQVIFMDENVDVGICGAWIETIGEIEGDIWRYPTSHNELKEHSLFYSALAHPTVIFRKEFFRKFDLKYDFDYLHAEDYQLWTRAVHLFEIRNIGEVLLYYRITSDSTSRKNEYVQEETVKKIREENLMRMGIRFKENELILFNKICNYKYNCIDENNIFIAVEILNNIYENSKIVTKEFKKILCSYFITIILAQSKIGFSLFRYCFYLKIFNSNLFFLKEKIKFIIKCVVRYDK